MFLLCTVCIVYIYYTSTVSTMTACHVTTVTYPAAAAAAKPHDAISRRCRNGAISRRTARCRGDGRGQTANHDPPITHTHPALCRRRVGPIPCSPSPPFCLNIPPLPFPLPSPIYTYIFTYPYIYTIYTYTPIDR